MKTRGRNVNPVISIDPGREKCGVAVVSKEVGVLWKQVLDAAQLIDVVKKLAAEFHSNCIVLGNGTSSEQVSNKLEMAFLEESMTLKLVDEYRTTDAAKIRYWKENPPRGLKRLIPTSMQVPPVPVDDYVAVILAERYLCVE